MPIAVHIVCASAITLRSCTLADKQAIVSRLACASINSLQVLTRQQNKRARTSHLDLCVRASVGHFWPSVHASSNVMVKFCIFVRVLSMTLKDSHVYDPRPQNGATGGPSHLALQWSQRLRQWRSASRLLLILSTNASGGVQRASICNVPRIP